MKIVLATGIYPPDIGGPATYVEKIAAQFLKAGHQVWVITYQTVFIDPDAKAVEWPVIRVAKNGGPLGRWRRFAKALREHASDADVVIAFSSVSCGIPLHLAKLDKPARTKAGGKGPKTILRLGGDFFWERYTALGGQLGLRAWHGTESPANGGGWKLRMSRTMNRQLMSTMLNNFDAVVYSTDYQKKIHEGYYKKLPKTLVLENALPMSEPVKHELHDPLRLLYLGRFVGFKNIRSLVASMALLPNATLTLVGSGPERLHIDEDVARLGLTGRVTVRGNALADEKRKIFDEHDMLVMPSITEISPNAALEARGSGLPVLITDDTGLSDTLTTGMQKAVMRAPEDIAAAVNTAKDRYAALAGESVSPLTRRGWDTVAGEWVTLFSSLS